MGNVPERHLSARIRIRSAESLDRQFLLDAERAHPMGNVRPPGQYPIAAQDDVMLAEETAVNRMEILFQRRGAHFPVHVHWSEV